MDEELKQEMTQAEFDAAEDAAFTAGFDGANVAAPVAEPAAEPAAEAPAAEAPAAEAPAAEAPAADAPKPVLAGLTEDQVAQALARVSQQQTTIDKLGGRLGQLMQTVESLKTQPRTVADQRSFDLKLEKLGEAFPELAEMLREDLKGFVGGPAQASEQPEVQTFTADDVNRIVTEKLTTFQQQQERGLEVRMLSTAHPEWQKTIQTPQFALWRDNVIEDGKELMESESAAFISLRLTQFKDWVKATSVAPTQQTPAPVQQQARPNAQQRLANAVLPRGQDQGTTPAAVTEEDAFLTGFNAERSKTGH